MRTARQLILVSQRLYKHENMLFVYNPRSYVSHAVLGEIGRIDGRGRTLKCFLVYYVMMIIIVIIYKYN